MSEPKHWDRITSGLDKDHESYSAETIPAHGNARLEVRFHIRQVRFVERFYSESQAAWITQEEQKGESKKTGTSKQKSHCAQNCQKE